MDMAKHEAPQEMRSMSLHTVEMVDLCGPIYGDAVRSEGTASPEPLLCSGRRQMLPYVQHGCNPEYRQAGSGMGMGAG